MENSASLKTVINLNYKPCARLTEKNFHDCTDPYDIALIETFTQNCGHCMTLLKEFDKAAHHLNIPLFSINMDVQKTLIDKLGVTETPTLLIHRKDKSPIVYSGTRTANEVIRYLERLVDSLKIKLPSNKDIFKNANIASTKPSKVEYPVSNAIDDDAFSTWVGDAPLPISLIVSFLKPQTFFGYELHRPSGGEDSIYLQPASWKVYASNDENVHNDDSNNKKNAKSINWELLDYRSPGCLPNNRVSFCFVDTDVVQDYKHFKIEFFSNAGIRTKHPQNSVAISDFKLHNGECQYNTFETGEFCEKLPDQIDFDHPKPSMGRHENFGCFVKGGFDDARVEIITGLLITGEADKAEYVIDDVAHGVRSVYDMQLTRNAIEEIMHSHKYNIEIEYGHPSALCEDHSRVCERKVWPCAPVKEGSDICLAAESKIFSAFKSQYITSKANTADCYGAYAFDYLRYEGFASSSLMLKLNRAFHMNGKVLEVTEEIMKQLPKHFACVFYDSTNCAEMKSRKKRAECYQNDIKSKMQVKQWNDLELNLGHITMRQKMLRYGKQSDPSVDADENEKITIFMHSQNHKISSKNIVHGKKSIWDMMKQGKPKIPSQLKPKTREEYQNMAMNIEEHRDDKRKGDLKKKNLPRTVEFMEDVVKAFVPPVEAGKQHLRFGITNDTVKHDTSNYNLKTLDNYIWVRAGSDFRNEIAQRRDDEARGAIAWQVCTSASSLWLSSESPFSQTLASYICGKLNSRKKDRTGVGNGDRIDLDLTNKYVECDVQYRGTNNEWIEISVY
eukprot:g4865.t1